MCTVDIEASAERLHDHSYFREGTADLPPDDNDDTSMDTVAHPGYSSSHDEMSEDEHQSTHSQDPDFVPESDDSGGETDTDSEEDVSPSLSTNPMYLVYHSNLTQLFSVCHEPGCKEPLSHDPEYSITGLLL